MFGALEELADLSLALQKADIFVAHRMISRQIEVFLARKDTMGNYYAEACRSVEEEGRFKAVELSESAGREERLVKHNSIRLWQTL